MADREVFIVGAARTPLGAFQGALATVSAPRLGAVAIEAALARAGVRPEQVDCVYMGNVLSAGVGQAPARQAALFAGVPEQTPCTTVGKVCGSGLEAVILGARAILAGDAELVVGGGMESMTNAPYLLPKARSGLRLGHGEVLDAMLVDGLLDPYGSFHMGEAGDRCAEACGLSRQAQDAYAAESYTRARRAQERGELRAEIAPVTVRGKGGDVLVEEDEEPGRGNLAKMPGLKPAFRKEGTITAANASKINDGAAALVLASGEAVVAQGLTPLARLVSYAGHAHAPEQFSTAPAFAVKKALARAGLGVSDIDLFEINEAFAAVAMIAERDLEVPRERLNVRGGAVALGHPIGCSGARILTTLLYALRDRAARYGVASLCIGGGEALSVVVERTPSDGRSK